MPSKVMEAVLKKTAEVMDNDDEQEEIHPNEEPRDDIKPAETPKKKPIKRIILIGERHSGTSYTTEMLTGCYPKLQVSNTLVRFKHWFQPTPEFVVKASTLLQNVTKQQMKELEIPLYWPELASLENPEDAFEDTLVINLVRNVHDWIEAMREGPHHWPNHFRLFRFPDGPREDANGNGRMHEYGVRNFSWQDFVKANMTLVEDRGDANHLCQNGFLYGTISPCLYGKELYPEVVHKDYAPDMSAAPDYLNLNADKPNYELDPNGKPFDDPLALRAAKIQNFLDIANHWNLGGFMTVQYEEVNAKGAEFILQAVSQIVGTDASCEPDPPKHHESKQLPEAWEKWITEHADWKTERSVGYEPRELTNVKPESQKTAVVPKAQVSSNLKKESFDRIILLGERHSGTTYTTKTLERCFPDIEVSDFLVRFKHWFQPTPDFVVDTTKGYLSNDMTEEEGVDMFDIHNQWPNIAALEDPKRSAFKKTLLIVMFRNPYDWLEAMRTGPHHWNNHFSLYRFPRAPVPGTTGNPWYGSNFTTWTDFIKANMTFTDKVYNETRLCQNGFLSGSVTPCLKSKEIYPQEVKRDYPDDVNEAPDSLPFNAHNPIYELDPNGQPYPNPLAFRTAKIQNFLDIPNNWDLGSFMTLRQEDINAKGSGFLLEQVSKIVGQEPNCTADRPKNQPSKKLNSDWEKWITEHADWETEGKVGYEPKEPIKRIVLIGERHSGTSYTTQMLAKCFPKLDVSNFLGRFKHWFQPTPEYMLNATKTLFADPNVAIDMPLIHDQWPKLMSRVNPKAAFKNTVLIVMFRNAYDWTEAMREGPHHWPNHFDLVKVKLGEYDLKSYHWKKFVNASMTLAGDGTNNSSRLCQNAYPFGAVSPCVMTKDLYPEIVKKDYVSDLSAAPAKISFNAHNPIYELDPNGKPFAHPLELRTAKIKNFLDIPNKWDLGGFLKLRHEDVNEKGPLFLLNILSKMVGMPYECTPDPAMRQRSKQLKSDWEDWITKHANWEAEKEIGYEPRVATNSKQGL